MEILSALGHQDAARAELKSAALLGAGPAADSEALAFAAFSLGEHELSRRFYAQVRDRIPSDALAWYNLATSERNLGALEDAEAACNQALELDQNLAQAALLRAHLRTQSAAENHVDDLIARLRRAGSDAAATMFLNYALGKELDDLGDYDGAFRAFDRGAKVRRATLNYKIDEDQWKLSRIREAFSKARLAGAPPPDPQISHGIIVGLPRSGTTMIERVITGHPEVATNGETDNLVRALLDGAARSGGDVFERVAAGDRAVASASYERRAAGSGRRLTLEKLPLNYLYAGAVALQIPRARLVLVTRGAADNLFAMFSTLFGNGYPFSYDQDELAAYYLAYRALTAHWKANLGDRLLEVRYENFVSEPAAHGSELAEFLGLDWRPGMVRIEQNSAPSATASAAQVRKPIYQSAVGRWRNYANHLEPMLECLRAAGVDPESEPPGDR